MDNTEKSKENKLLTAALQYAALGLYVFPLKPGQKSPAVKGWQEKSTTDTDAIRAWWRENPRYNVGIYCEKSGLIVVDFDAAHDRPGLQFREQWHRENDLPVTWIVKTPRGGVHEYYKDCRGTGETKVDVRPGVDTRAAGGLVPAPPSVFEGNTYTWENAPLIYPLADATAAVYELFDQIPTGAKKGPYRAPETVAEGGRTNALVALAGSLVAKGLDPETIETAIRSENEKKCIPPLTDQELEREVFPGIYREKWQLETHPYTHDRPVPAPLLERLKELDPANNSKLYGMNDAGSARLFIDTCGARVLYAEDRKKWLFYDGKRWNIHGENGVKEQLKRLADALVLYVLQSVTDESKRAAWLKFAGKWQMLRTREVILKDAQSVQPVRSESFDADRELLNVENGTLDLRTLEFREHRPGDLITHKGDVIYDPGATSPRWLQFIDEITSGDKEKARYIQKAAGYALTGDTSYECLFICYGPTSRNGKSTLLETLAAMMGDYGAAARPESLTKNKFKAGNAHSEDIARLSGARMVTVSEPPQGMELDNGLVKSLTGKNKITARRLNENSFEFFPQFKLFIDGNHRPRIDDMSVFDSDRIKLIPFNRHFAPEERDHELKKKLTAPESMSGILNWCLEGLQMLRKEGFREPPAVEQATAEYRLKMDKIKQFLDEKCELGASFEVPLMELHSAFAIWCGVSGLLPLSVPKFKASLEERQLHTKKKRPAGTGRNGKTQIFILGVRLTQETEEN